MKLGGRRIRSVRKGNGAMISVCYTNSMPTNELVADRSVVPRYSWYALAVLTAVYVLNFLDRTLIYILFTPIKKEMAFSDLQLALLGTTSFVIFYTLLGIPFGRVADRSSRTKLIAIGLAVWSLFSGLTGFAHGFWAIFLCRVMVGVGEATLGPAAFSLLSDFFPPRMRATVQSAYASGIAIGGGLAFFLGGWIGQTYGWRRAFFFVGFPGLALAVLVFLLREPVRGRMETAASATTDWRALLRSVPLRYLILGYSFIGLASNNITVWVGTFFVRAHGLSLALIGYAAGIMSIAIGVPVMIFAGYFSDRLGSGRRTLFTASAAALSVPLWIALLFTNDLRALLVINVVLYAAAILWVGPSVADVHDIAGPNLRGLAIGIFFSSVNIFAFAIGSPLIGKLTDRLGDMRYSLLVCPVSCAIGALLLWMGRRRREAVRLAATVTATSA